MRAPPTLRSNGSAAGELLAKVALALGATGAALAVALFLLHRFANSGDEYSYLLQAEIFAKGRLSIESAPSDIRAAFDVDHVLNDGRVRSKYFPGWPVLMSLGVLLHAPWLVNPLLAGVTAWALFGLIREDGSSAAALWGSAFGVLNPFFLLNAGSYNAHIAELAWTTMAVAGARPVSPSRSAIAIVAFSFAGLMATRPIECVGLLVVVVACARRRALVAALVGVAGGALVLAAYDSVQFGGPFSTGYALYQTSFSRLYPAEGPAFSLSNIAFVREHLTQLSSFFGWCFPVWLFVPFGWTSLDSRQRRWLAALVVVPIATLQLMPPLAGDSYGPRYLLGLVLPMAWSAGRGVKTLQRRFGPIAPWTALAALLGCLGINSESMRAFGRQIDRRSKPLQVVEAAGLKRAIVLLPPNLGPYGAHWLVRNGATMDGPVLLAASGSSARDAQVLAWAAGREAYRLEGRGRTIRLRRIWSALNSIETP